MFAVLFHPCVADGPVAGPSDITKIVKMIMLKNYNPVIIFAFSKRECEALALNMSKLEVNNADEQAAVEGIFTNAINNLSEVDRQLPQIAHLLPLLKRGIGIHHGGLLPILKEVIEILFQEGLIKVLFATETFSIGLNMPAKTVVFTNVRKFDGKEHRNLTSGEYIQMSGRAGRRGLDERGVVIMMCDEKLEPTAAKGMIKGEADRLDSAFHLGYNMVLNLMKVEGISPEYMLERCFYQFQNNAGVPLLEDRECLLVMACIALTVATELRREDERMSSIVIEDEEDVADYYELRKKLDELAADFKDVITHPSYSLPFLQPGRLVKIKHLQSDFGWGVVIHYQKRFPPKASTSFHTPFWGRPFFDAGEACPGQRLAAAGTVHRRRAPELCTGFGACQGGRQRPPVSGDSGDSGRNYAVSIRPEGRAPSVACAALDDRGNQPPANIPAEGSKSAPREGDCVEERARVPKALPRWDRPARSDTAHGHQGRQVQNPRQGACDVFLIFVT